MADQILVIEYEPRYTDRIREALNTIGVPAVYAKDGDEALSILSASRPALVVLSSVIPRYSTGELIRKIRSKPGLTATPILLTVSGYSGGDHRSDAAKFGATDILPKPYTPSDLAGKASALLGLADAPAETPSAHQASDPDPLASAETVRMSTDELLGDLAGSRPAPIPGRKASLATDDVDKMLADTLSGVRLPGARKKSIEKPAGIDSSKTSADLDKLLHDTLSGLDKKPRPKTESSPKSEEPPPPAKGYETVPLPALDPDDEPARQVQEAAPAPAPVVDTPAPMESPDPVPSATTLLSERREEPSTEQPAQVPFADDEIDSDQERFGQYVLLERIATGGMAEVWKARMRGLEGFEKIVAIKKILPHLSDNQEFVDMFVDEAKLAAQLNHNNIIHIYDLGKIADSYYIAMEYIDGQDLKSILRRGAELLEPMPVSVALSVATKLAAALNYAHRKKGYDDQELGIVHRDVSPQNVLISYEGDIKLCDFGIAKAATKASNTQAGALKGKLQYMSPEQAWGRPIDRRSDIFSVASVLFEMLTGRKLFVGESELSILDQVREAKVVPPSTYNDELTREIDALVLKGLARDADQRYQTAGEMAKAIDSVLYNFRPTPTSADLAIYMHRIYESGLEPPVALLVPEPAPTPKLDEIMPTMQASAEELGIDLTDDSAAATVAMPIPDLADAGPPSEVIEEAESGRKVSPLLIGVIALVVVGGAIAGWVFMGKGGGTTPPVAVPAAQTASPQTSPPSIPGGEGVVDEAEPITPELVDGESAGELGAEDLAMIDEEVQRRLDAEKRRLAQQTAGAPEPVVEKTTQPEPRPAAPAAQKATPETSTPVPTPERPAESPPPATAEPTAAPAKAVPTSAKPAEPTVKEGDLVQPGTPGLVEPVLVEMKPVAYPRIAKRQRVEGIVIVRALISETGNVVEATVIRGVSQNVGLNEAAVEMLKGSKFKPATLNGVRVRTYKTVPIPFKL